MRSEDLKRAMFKFGWALNLATELFRQFSESLCNDDIDQAYVWLDELTVLLAGNDGKGKDLLAGLYDEEVMKKLDRAEKQISAYGRAPAVFVREDVDRMINNLKKTQEEAENAKVDDRDVPERRGAES